MRWIITEHAIDRWLERGERMRRVSREKARELLETMAAHGHTLAASSPRGDELREFGSVVLVVKRRDDVATVVTVMRWRMLAEKGIAR